ncbi:MAG: hypothetical protein QXX38_00535 [Candidatus Aenigmatarchaeota archaeon]
MAYIFEDDILAPKRDLVIEYRGPNPFAIYRSIPDLLMRIFQARGVHIFEDDFRWDITDDPRPFFVRFHLDKGLDKWTRAYVWVRLQGRQPSDPSKQGSNEILIGGTIVTRYPVDTVWQKIFIKPFIWLYHHLIYNNIRRRYIQIYKAGIERLEAEIRSAYNLVMRERLT